MHNSRKTTLNIPVSIAKGRPKEYHLCADLHEPENNDATAIQVLLSGGFYTREHWDFPYKPELYSYAQFMTAHGWPCLAMDRIGNGNSSRPPSEEVDLPNSAYTIHQVVQDLRAGKIGGRKYDRVILVGHSTGSAVATIEGNTYQDVEGLVLTGWAHTIPDMGSYKGWSWQIPTSEDPKLAHLHLDDGYLAIRADAIAPAFYNPDTVDPEVLKVEAQLKDTYCVREGATIPLSLDTRNYRGAVLIANGMLDPFPFAKNREAARNSATAAASELPYWHPDVDLQAVILPKFGHVLNTCAGHLLFHHVLAWANSAVGRQTPALRSRITEMDAFGLKEIPAESL